MGGPGSWRWEGQFQIAVQLRVNQVGSLNWLIDLNYGYYILVQGTQTEPSPEWSMNPIDSGNPSGLGDMMIPFAAQTITWLDGKIMTVENLPACAASTPGILTATQDVNLRDGPSADFAQLAVVLGGSQVESLGETSNDWIKVRYQDQVGWINSKYLR